MLAASGEEGRGQEGSSEEGSSEEGTSEEGTSEEGACGRELQPSRAPAKKAAAKQASAKKPPKRAGQKAAAKESPAAQEPPQNRRPPRLGEEEAAARSARAPTLRLRVTFGVMAFVLSLFAGRLVLLQGVDPDSYALAASKENTKPFVLHASRGAILDRNGVPLSVSEDAVAITADPTQTQPVAQQFTAILAPKLTSTTSAKLLAAMTGKAATRGWPARSARRPGTTSRPS